MNHVYRIVFNRALGLCQVVSELASAHGGGSAKALCTAPRPSLLASACLLALGMTMAGAAGAQTVVEHRVLEVDDPADLTGDVTLGIGGELRGTADVTLANRLSIDTGTTPIISAATDTTLTLTGGFTSGADGNLVFGSAGHTGTVVIGAAGGSISGALSVDHGTLAIESGTVSTTNPGIIGTLDSSNGSVSVSGPGATWNTHDFLYVGMSGTGTLSVKHGGKVSVSNGNGVVEVALNATAAGAVNIGGAVGEIAEVAGTLEAGELHFGAGFGSLNFNHTDLDYIFGTRITGAGAVNQVAGTTVLTGANSYTGGTRVSDGTLIGNASSLQGGIHNNAKVIFDQTTAGTYAGAMSGSGILTKTGSGTLTLTGGNSHAYTFVEAGTLAVGGGGTVNGIAGHIGQPPGSTAAATVRGAGSAWINSTELVIGLQGTGNLTVADGGAVSNTRGIIGYIPSGRGNATVTGAGSRWSNSDSLSVGSQGSGTLTVADGGKVSVNGGAGLVNVARDGTATGVVNIGAAVGATAAAAGTLEAGELRFGAGTGSLNFNHTNSAYTFGTLITGAGAVNQVAGTTRLTGANTYSGGTVVRGGTLAISSDNNLGAATGSLTLDGGTLTSIAGVSTARAVTVGASGGTVDVTPGFGLVLTGVISGYALTKTGGLVILTADNTYTDTTISTGTLQVGAATTTGSLGNGKVFNNAALVFYRSNTLLVGNDISGSGQVTQVGSGDLVLTGTNTYAGTTTINGGTLQVGDGGTTDTLGNGRVINNAALVFNRSDALTVSNDISGTGTLLQAGSGTTALTGNLTHIGNTTISDGTLAINGSVAGNVQVNAAGTLGGNGHIGGNVNVQGTLSAGNSPGALSIAGNLVLDAASTSVFELGQARVVGGPANDLVEVGGDLTLGGTLQAQVASAGWYRLFNYGGALSGSFNTTQVSSARAGFTVDSHALDTATVQQVNLTVLGAGQRIQFWDGSHTIPSGLIGGAGDTGNWNSADTTWTDDSAISNSSWAGSVAHFGGTAGTVSVVGTQRFDTLQFASDGYLVSGGNLALSPASGSNATINTDAGVTATIASTLINSGLSNGLTKVGGGTLILSGANSYTGAGTDVLAGTLVVANNAALGSHQVVVDNVAGDNATLQVNAGITLGNSVFIDNNGTLDNYGVIEQAGSSFGVQSMGGATINNAAGASIRSDGYGVVLYDGGTVNNRGGEISADIWGIRVAGAGVDINNSAGGSIGGDESGVVFSAGGTINNAGGTIIAHSTSGISRGIQIDGGAGTVINSAGGMISGQRQGVILAEGGAVTNAAGATIHGGETAVYSYDATRLSNAGTLKGDVTLADNLNQVLLFTGSRIDGDLRIGSHAASTLTLDGGGSQLYSAAVTGNTQFEGVLSKQGSGSWIIDSDLIHRGGTIITAGTLQIGNGGSSGSLEGDVLNNSTLAFNRSDDLVFAGNISGSGALQQLGSGTTTLSGNNHFSGGTRVTAGILSSSANSLGSGAIDIAAPATLVMQQHSDASFANAFTGSGVINKNGNATLLLTGNSSAFNGTTHINVGTLSVNGSLGGTLNVHDSAVLKGTGSIGSTVVMAGGTIAPGNSIGRLDVTGDLTFAAGSTYQIEATPDGNADHIHADGSIALLGGSAMVLAADGSWSPRTTYQVLSADGGISGAFDEVTANFAFLTPTLANDGHTLSMTLARNQVLFPAVATTPNQIATSAAVENLGAGNGLYDAVVQLDEATAISAFDQLSGEVHASVRSNLIQDSRFVREAAIDRLRQSEGAQDAASELSNDGTAWGRVHGNWGRQDGDGNAARSERSNGGIVAGSDRQVGSWNVGLMAAASHSKLDVDARRSHAKVDSYQLGLYAGTPMGDAVQLRSGALLVRHLIETDRTISFTGVNELNRADYHASSIQAFGELGWKLPTTAVELEPFANLAYVCMTTKSFREDGGISALSARKESSDTLFSTLGIRAGNTFNVGTVQANWRVMAGWRHAFNDVASSAKLTFASDGASFAIHGLPVANDALAIEAGAELTLRPNIIVGAAYSGQHGDGARDHGLKANVTWTF